MSGGVLIRQLEYLVSLADERHFGRAARACGISQPALSAAIRKLEQELDVTLVERRGHTFHSFTPEGERVIAWAHRILTDRDDMRTDLDRMRGDRCATLRIGTIPTAIPMTPLITGPFREAHPHATVQVERMSAQRILRGLDDLDLDVGVTYLDDERVASMRTIELYREQYLVLMPADSELAAESVVGWAAAADLPLCTLVPAMHSRFLLDTTMAAAGARMNPVVETDSVDAMYAHVSAGGLSSIVSHAWLFAFGVPAAMCVRPLAPQEAAPSVGLVALDREPARPAAAAVWKIAQSLDVAGDLDQAAALISTAKDRGELDV
jgi:DNA-binding transcriptional LysR family regulator